MVLLTLKTVLYIEVYFAFFFRFINIRADVLLERFRVDKIAPKFFEVQSQPKAGIAQLGGRIRILKDQKIQQHTNPKHSLNRKTETT